MDRYCGRFPRPVEQMWQLPGIGKYTAHAVASFAFNQSVPIVEANTARVLTRLFDFRESIDSVAGRKTLWQHAATLLPKSNARIYNSALIDLGALVCIPRRPKCGICPVKKSAAQNIRKRCRSGNLARVQRNWSKSMHLWFVRARSCWNNRPDAGAACGFCRLWKLTALSSRVLTEVRFTRPCFRSQIIG